MKRLRCRIKDCSNADLVKLARKCGFKILQGGSHTKVELTNGRRISTIPRHNYINAYTAKQIVNDFNRFGANIEIC